MVGIVLVSHPGIASAMHEQARTILQKPLDSIQVVEVSEKGPASEAMLSATIEDLDQGDGVLLLTDLPCATPANLAVNCAGENCLVISGLNLPMLIRVCNYQARPLAELGGIALEGAHNGIQELP